MNIALVLLGAVSCAALPGGLADPLVGYSKQPRAPQIDVSKFNRGDSTYVKCSKKTKKVKLEAGEYAMFDSPNYPENYSSKKTCKYQFKSDEDITIACYDFELEKAKKGKCKNDYLKIGSESYCGTYDYFYYYGSTSVKVQFKSNKKKNYGGFYCWAWAGSMVYSTYGPNTSPDKPTGSTEAPPTTDPDFTCQCGQANAASRIVNGTETAENQYPWQAAMVYSGTSSVFCGGSVIGSKHILTAAHCTQAVTDYSLKYQVLVGAHNLTNSAESELRLDAIRFIQHADYDSSTYDNDIAIIVLKGSGISFANSDVRPVCLPTSDDNDYDDVDAIVSGWGALESGGKQPDVLMEVTVPTMTNTKCLKYYPNGITDNMLCAGYKEGMRDSCQGDSGGPLTYNSDSAYVLIGVVSWGNGCAWPRNPGVYARVTKYLTWIESNTASSKTCDA